MRQATQIHAAASKVAACTAIQAAGGWLGMQQENLPIASPSHGRATFSAIH